MSLKQTLSEAVSAAFEALGDIPTTMTYHKVTLGAYDVEADTQTLTETTVSVQGVMYSGRDLEQDGTRRLTSAQSKNTNTDETKIIIPAAALPGYTPTLRDYLTIDGVRWEVWATEPIPTNPAWILKVRT